MFVVVSNVARYNAENKETNARCGTELGKEKGSIKKTSKQPVTYDDTKFETEGAWLVYKNVTSSRNIIPERRVLISDFANELLGHVIQRNKWETFVATPRVAYVEIVKEFYANIHDNLDNPEHPQYQQVYMRGQYIPFSPLAILWYYELDNTETDILQAPNTNLQEVVTSICQGIDHWPDGSSTLNYNCLLPQVRTLDKMVSANILPTTHTSTVNMERARLLHWLQTKPLNIGNYIFANVLHIRNNRRCLAFPSLITGLCEISQGPIGGQSNVPGQPEPARDDPMAEDLYQSVTEPTLASISHKLHQWRTSNVEIKAHIREIREAQVQEVESRRREHDALSTQMTQLLGYFSLYLPPPPQ
ncbi:putative S-locus lectin protein kinase family protein [Abeliophyllum distichum]|uniref:S-locus lectin protein kinase family protein n=1 Tax=Abeliophyllum distichum TaxID=126358 RepID=A0ABD1NUA4_9LAMI